MKADEYHDSRKRAKKTPSTRFSKITDTMATLCEKLERTILTHPSFEGQIVFGPVPSRRLGKSLGVNNVKRKMCTYDCVYCQAGPTTSCSTCRDCSFSPYELYFFVKHRIDQLEREKIHVDYISFVPNGEPTLDIGLSKAIVLLREFGHKIAVFTNASLLWNDNVKEDLLFADYVSVKVDTVDEATWEGLNRPHRRLRLDTILGGIKEFAADFRGVLTTETMLVRHGNDSVEEIHDIGCFLERLKRDVSYFTVPTRPPSEAYAVRPDDKTLEVLSDLVRRSLPDSKMLCVPESGDFITLGSVEEDLRGILAVHPMRAEAVENLVMRTGRGMESIEHMIHEGVIQKVMHEGKGFYVCTH
jgi:wyosine [tRNA(Phe)-imidazoG37] synthetase (radical SAM superfamily)